MENPLNDPARRDTKLVVFSVPFKRLKAFQDHWTHDYVFAGWGSWQGVQEPSFICTFDRFITLFEQSPFTEGEKTYLILDPPSASSFGLRPARLCSFKRTGDTIVSEYMGLWQETSGWETMWEPGWTLYGGKWYVIQEPRRVAAEYQERNPNDEY